MAGSYFSSHFLINFKLLRSNWKDSSLLSSLFKYENEGDFSTVKSSLSQSIETFVGVIEDWFVPLFDQKFSISRQILGNVNYLISFGEREDGEGDQEYL